MDFFIYPLHIILSQYKSVGQIDFKISTGHDMRVQLQINKVSGLTHQKAILVHAAQIKFIRFQLFFLNVEIRIHIKLTCLS